MIELEDLIRKGDRPDYHSRAAMENVLLPRLNRFLKIYKLATGVETDPEVTRGWSTPEHNSLIGGKPGSLHLMGLAVDLRDREGLLGTWALGNQNELELCGLWMEDPRSHPDQPHVHLDCKARVHTVFLP